MFLKTKILALALFLMIIGACGFFAGRWILLESPDYFASFDIPAPEKQVFESEATYIAVTPNIGPLARTIYTHGFSFRWKKTTATLLNKKAKDIEKGQRVVFYDKKGKTHPTLGTVLSVAPKKEKTTITFEVPEDLKPNIRKFRARIILQDNNFSRRLPYETLVSTDRGERYVWTLLPNRDGTFMLKRHETPSVLDGDDYYHAEYRIGTDTPVILNPPEGLKNGQVVMDVEIFDLDAPTQNLAEQVQEEEFQRMAQEFSAEEYEIRKILGVHDCAERALRKKEALAALLTSEKVPVRPALPDNLSDSSQSGSACGK